MGRFPHDQFAKQYLAELLAPLGEVETSRDVPGELRQIDVWFAPTPQQTANPEVLGLLGRFASSPCLLEPFRNPPTPTEIRNCLLKLFELQGELQRKARRDSERLKEADAAKIMDSLTFCFSGAVEWIQGYYRSELVARGLLFRRISQDSCGGN